MSIAYEQNNDILEQPAIEQLYLILKLLVHIKKGEVSAANELLSQTLPHAMWTLDSKVLWQFAISQQSRHDWFAGLLASNNKQLQHIGEWLNWLTKLSSQEPLAVVIEYVLGLRNNDILASPLKAYFFSGRAMTNAYIETLSALQLLRALVSEFRAGKRARVEDFVDFIELLHQNNKLITDTSPFVSGDKRVELLTVHKAKGLEFDAVLVLDATDSEWSPQVRGRVPPANLPLRPAEDDSDDYVRLMYVAATRARHTLVFGSYDTSLKGESVMPALSLSDIQSSVVKPEASQALVAVLENALRWPQLDQRDEQALLKPQLETYTMNVTNLINFLDVSRGGPQYFKERNLLRLPSAKAPAAALGSAVHAALKEAQQRVNAGTYKLKPIVTVFEKELLQQGLPEADYKKRLASGKQLLARLLEKHGWTFIKGAHPEYKVVDVALPPAQLSGTLDVLDTTGERTVISDYKTGRPLTSLALKSGPAGLRAWRHQLQLTFYALLIVLDPTIAATADAICQMVYVEAVNKQDLILQYQPTENELTHLGSLIKVVWEHIMRLDFPDTGHYSPDLKGVRAFEADLLNGKI